MWPKRTKIALIVWSGAEAHQSYQWLNEPVELSFCPCLLLLQFLDSKATASSEKASTDARARLQVQRQPAPMASKTGFLARFLT